MATEFIDTTIPSTSPALTSEAGAIAVMTDADHLTVTISNSNEQFFSSELYAYNGVVELFDTGTIIEEYFRQHEIVEDLVTVTFGSVALDILFLYCENRMPPEFVPANVQLLSSTVRRVHRGSRFTVAAIPTSPSPSVIFKAVGHDRYGNIASLKLPAASMSGNMIFKNFSVVGDVVKVATTKSVSVPVPLKDVLYFSAEHEGRQQMCYITPSSAFLTFRFRNIYNVLELLDVEGAMVTKPDTSRQTAFCENKIVQYDRRTDRTYQFVTGPLPAEEVESLRQLLSSYSVELYQDGTYYGIAIEDYTCEDSTEDDALTTVKFTWRFKDRRPVAFGSDLFGIRRADRGIFAAQYSPEYD